MAAVVLAAVVTMAAALLVWSVISGGTNTALVAPVGDFVTRITPAMVRGDDAQQNLQQQVGPDQVVPGSVVFVGRARSVVGAEHDLFTWRALPDPRMPAPGGMTCFGQFAVGEGGGGASCGDNGPNNGPGLGWGSGGEANTVNVENLPRGSAWIVVDTDSGARIVGNVVADVAFVSWPSGAGSPRSIQVLDQQHRRLWSETMAG